MNHKPDHRPEPAEQPPFSLYVRELRLTFRFRDLASLCHAREVLLRDFAVVACV